MKKIEKILKAVSLGVGESCGCNDGDTSRARKWIKLAKSKKPEDEKTLCKLIIRAVAYGD